jgi:hypothetical protein
MAFAVGCFQIGNGKLGVVLESIERFMAEHLFDVAGQVVLGL